MKFVRNIWTVALCGRQKLRASDFGAQYRFAFSIRHRSSPDTYTANHRDTP
jgi:hypothetical protein